jgi:hypothetical protein
MVLNPHSSHPNARSYVLKLHRDCGPDAERLQGRLEHIASGRHVEFASTAELLGWLLADMAAAAPAPLQPAPDGSH